MLRKLSKTIFLIAINMLVLISFSLASDINNVNIDIKTYSDGLAKLLGQSKPSSMKQVLYNYCEAVLKTSYYGANISGDFYYYSAKDSIFVYMMCNQISNDFQDMFNTKFNSKEDSYLKKTSFKDLGIIDYNSSSQIDYCDPNSSLNNELNYCDLTYHIPRVFNMIVNDIFSVQQSRVYGLLTTDFDKRSIEEQVDDYASDKFNIKFCDPTDGKYPKLCKTMKTYAKSSAKLLDKLDVLNYKNIYDNSNSPEIYNHCQNSYKKYDFDVLSCGLFGYGFNMNHMYLGLVYNEFMHYALFVKYYNYVILKNPNLAPVENRSDYNDAINYLKNNAYQFNRELNSSQKAISLSIKMLRELDVTFPLHVGFMMYQEDLLNLRDKSLYKIVTPFYTLYGKLRNVQVQE